VIYCIGLRARYEAALSGSEPVVKRGSGAGDYPGGWVWETPDGAQRFITANGLDATHAVYGVVADWQGDTRQNPGEPYRRLVRDAVVARISSS
jgi:hypothetical protein